MKYFTFITVLITVIASIAVAQFNHSPAVSIKDAIIIAEKAVENDPRFKYKYIGSAVFTSTSKKELCWRIHWYDNNVIGMSPREECVVEVLMDKTSNVKVMGLR